jgi:hypothetical protein
MTGKMIKETCAFGLTGVAKLKSISGRGHDADRIKDCRANAVGVTMDVSIEPGTLGPAGSYKSDQAVCCGINTHWIYFVSRAVALIIAWCKICISGGFSQAGIRKL